MKAQCLTLSLFIIMCCRIIAHGGTYRKATPSIQIWKQGGEKHVEIDFSAF